MKQWYAPRKADLVYLRVLGLAARTLESRWWILVYVGGAFVAMPLIGLLLFK